MYEVYAPRTCPLKYKQHNCRPNDDYLLETTYAKTNYGKRTFDYVGPRLWNALPKEVREMANIELFKKQVKTILFTNADGFKRKAFC